MDVSSVGGISMNGVGSLGKLLLLAELLEELDIATFPSAFCDFFTINFNLGFFSEVEASTS
jgi:hypothetical protein